MKRNLKYVLLLALAAPIFFSACKKTVYTFGNIKTPSNVTITTAIQGASLNATGDGSGNIKVTVAGTNALAFKIYWGDGDSLLTTLDTASHKYTKLDTNVYTITVNAIGTAGSTSTISKQVTVLYQFQIPADVMTALTNNSTKNWVPYADTTGNFGVGPASDYTPDYYQAGPNEKPTCAYDGVITFTQSGTNSITMNDNNQGQSFIIAAATTFYGQSGGDGCYAVATGGIKPISLGTANTGGGSSTGLQFSVPGTGLINFGTGSTTYQLIKLTDKVMILRDIGIDGNAWYQILKAQ